MESSGSYGSHFQQIFISYPTPIVVFYEIMSRSRHQAQIHPFLAFLYSSVQRSSQNNIPCTIQLLDIINKN